MKTDLEISESIKERAQSRYETNVSSIGKQLESYLEQKKAVVNAVNEGLYDPILEYYSFLASTCWVYFQLPLNKQLFLSMVGEMEYKGWKAGTLSISPNQAQIILKYPISDTSEPRELTVCMSAYGEGVTCRIVELKPEKRYEEGVYEWVCEEGAVEDDNISEMKGG